MNLLWPSLCGDRTVGCVGGEVGLQCLPWTHTHLSAERVQQELDEVLGTTRTVSYEDCEQLPYTGAVLHEVQRFSSGSGSRAPVCELHPRGWPPCAQGRWPGCGPMSNLASAKSAFHCPSRPAQPHARASAYLLFPNQSNIHPSIYP